MEDKRSARKTGVTKRIRFTRSDLLALCGCMLAALMIWLYAANSAPDQGGANRGENPTEQPKAEQSA